MSWSPEHHLQTGEALLSDLDGVVHGDHHGVGLRLWRNIARAGLWNTLQNRHGMNGEEAEEAFAAEAATVDAGFRVLDDLAHVHMFDFVQLTHPPVRVDEVHYRKILHDTVREVASGYRHDDIIEEMKDIIGSSGRPGVFITNSPLTPATLLVDAIFRDTPTMVFAPFDVCIGDGHLSLKVAYPGVRLHKGSFARLVMEDLNIEPSDTVGFGDTESDMPLFDVLGRAIAVNPTVGLRAYAENHGLEIRDILTTNR